MPLKMRQEKSLAGEPKMHHSKLSIAALAATILAWPVSEARALDDWNTVLAKAREEGTVVVHGAPGKRYAEALVGAFNKAHPDIRVQFSGASGRVDTPKLLRERKANIYAWDVWISGPSTAVGRLKPLGVFQPLRQYLTKDTMDDKHWQGGFDAGWMDVEKKYYYTFDGTTQNPIQVNWDFVKKSSITSIKDLLKPEFAGKIVWDDPRFNGSGNGSSQTIYENFGEDFLRALYKQKIVFVTNRRQLAEWVVRGRYPIGIGVGENDLAVFQKQGLGKNVEPLPDSFYKIQQQSSGFGALGVVDRAPHPNAAAVYVNWLLSKAGQEAWAGVPRNSRRVDVKPGDPTLAPRPGVTYFNGQEESRFKTRMRLQEIAKETITAEMPKKKKRSKKKE
jgi:iron(III) transport system substrate-binding protein